MLNGSLPGCTLGNKTREENIGERKLREVEVGYAEGKWMRVWGRRGAGEGGGGGEGGGSVYRPGARLIISLKGRIEFFDEKIITGSTSNSIWQQTNDAAA